MKTLQLSNVKRYTSYADACTYDKYLNISNGRNNKKEPFSFYLIESGAR